MRKGDQTRQDMLAAAERLFLSRGYEATSVQDILNVLHASKGGFYHHFSSKEDVLKLLCAQRAERAAEWTAAALQNAAGDMERINTVLRGFTPLRMEEAEFVRMLLPLITRSEGRAMAMIYQDALLEHFLPLLEREVAAAAANETVCPAIRGMEEAALTLVNSCWMAIAAGLGEGLDLPSMLTRVERYRRAVEVLLDAPFGSVEIVRFEELSLAASAIRAC